MTNKTKVQLDSSKLLGFKRTEVSSGKKLPQPKAMVGNAKGGPA